MTHSKRRHVAPAVVVSILVGMAAVLPSCSSIDEGDAQDEPWANEPTPSATSPDELEFDESDFDFGDEDTQDQSSFTQDPGSTHGDVGEASSTVAVAGDADDDSPEIVQFYGQTYEGDGFFVVIDRSESMQTSGELDIAKRDVIRMLTEFSDRVYFGVVFVGQEISKYPKSGRSAEARPSLKADAILWVKNVPAGSGSCVQEGLLAALTMANSSPARRKVILYLGDGGGRCKDQDQQKYLDQTLRAFWGANFQRAQCNTIGVLDVPANQEAFLRSLALRNRGTYTYISR